MGFRRKIRYLLSVNFSLALSLLIKKFKIWLCIQKYQIKFKLFKLNLHHITSDQISSYFFNQHLLYAYILIKLQEIEWSIAFTTNALPVCSTRMSPADIWHRVILDEPTSPHWYSFSNWETEQRWHFYHDILCDWHVSVLKYICAQIHCVN